MATQHPDNAHGPFWDDGDGFVAAHEEPEECLVCFRDLRVQEFMWDWEGKYADESVIDKLFSKHYAYFKKHLLGKNAFLTFRLPNVWQEKGYSLIRALMVILTSEDFAQDLAFRSRPLFEVILPMTERAEQLMYIQTSFQKLARFKDKVFNHHKNNNTDYVEVIPLVEGVEDQLHITKLLDAYVRLHEKFFHRKPAYIRPFLARSDPALISGFVANVLANKVALSEVYAFAKKTGVPVYPIIGAGGLVFRGGLNPVRIKKFAAEYAKRTDRHHPVRLPVRLSAESGQKSHSVFASRPAQGQGATRRRQRPRGTSPCDKKVFCRLPIHARTTHQRPRPFLRRGTKKKGAPPTHRSPRIWTTHGEKYPAARHKLHRRPVLHRRTAGIHRPRQSTGLSQ